MKKIFILIIGLATMFSLVTFSFKIKNQTRSTDANPLTTILSDTKSTEDSKLMNKVLTLKINNQEVDVSWLDNNSVEELKKLAEDGLTINMHMYGDFEHVGSIGSTISSADTNITTSPGDIVLYQLNQLVIFYGSNTWDYTKLGHINLSKSELNDLLGNDDVSMMLITAEE